MFVVTSVSYSVLNLIMDYFNLNETFHLKIRVPKLIKRSKATLKVLHQI